MENPWCGKKTFRDICCLFSISHNIYVGFDVWKNQLHSNNIICIICNAYDIMHIIVLPEVCIVCRTVWSWNRGMTIGGTMSTVTTLQFRSKPALGIINYYIIESKYVHNVLHDVLKHEFCFLMQWTCYNLNWAHDDIVSRRSLIIDDFVSRSTPSAKENHSAHRFTSPLGATP